MPVYPPKKLIYVHIPKTAGGAIEELLLPYKAQGRKTVIGQLRSKLPFQQNIDRAYIPGHATAAELMGWMGGQLWSEYVAFTVVRNPYDRVISEYEYVRQNPRHHRHKRALSTDFETYIQDRKLSQMPFLTGRDGTLLVQKIFRFEDLHSQLNTFFDTHGVGERLPERGNRNSSQKKPRDHYLTPRAIEIINSGASDDFDHLRYDRLDA